MELLGMSPPPSPALRLFHHPAVSAAAGARHGAASGDKIYVAVGRSPENALGLLRWTFRRFGCRDIGLLHVHHSSPLIPTLLGKVPANQANEELVSSHRRIEKETTMKILSSYVSYCHKAQVQASVTVTETEQIQSGIVDMVARHGIRKLIMGSAPGNFFKLKGGSNKANFTARNAPNFCEIWFISKGRHIWTREATVASNSFASASRSYEPMLREREDSCSKGHHQDVLPDPECNALINPEPQVSRMDKNELNSSHLVNLVADSVFICRANHCHLQDSRSLSNSASLPASSSDYGFSSDSISKGELEAGVLYEQYKELMEEVGTSRNLAFFELSKRKQLEAEVAEAFNRVKLSEAAYRIEAKIREEYDDLVKITKQQLEEFISKKDEVVKELQQTMDTISLLNSRVLELTLHRDEAAGELEFIKISIEILSLEKQKIHHQREESVDHLLPRSCNWPGGQSDDLNSFTEFTLSDLQTATCNFSKSFVLRQCGYGCVYKGEIRNRTVMIKKLHPHGVRGQIEFKQEAYVLSNLRHPHLVTVIGLCPEALAVVCEYMPNGTLRDHLACRTDRPITWKFRSRIIAGIASALLFLHSSKPGKVVHGNLVPENIFLDNSFNCKIGNLGICRLLPEDAEGHLLMHRTIDADPEYMTGALRPKADVYSFGIIILQLLTGKAPSGLIGEVLGAMLCGNLSSVVDPTAGEWPSDVAQSLAEFGLRCCESTSHNPPEITPEVVRELEKLHLREERPVPPYFVCPILQEIMHDPQVAADGFTYEERAMREWLDNGHETSPMTNLRLKHLNLIPNHALRFAIQDWLHQT